MNGLKEVVATYGIPMSLYSDRAGWAFHTPKAGGKVDKERLTQVGRALAQLGVEHIPGYTPQARGRGERVNRTLQDRLVNELRADGVRDTETANAYLHETFIPQYNQDFSRPARETASAFVAAGSVDLDQIFCVEEPRVVNKDNTVRFQNVVLQITKQPKRASCAGLTVAARRHLNGTISIWKGQKLFGQFAPDGGALTDGQEKKTSTSGFQGMEGSGMYHKSKGSLYPQTPSSDIPSPSPDYPSAGCSPAEPASVLSGA